MTNNGKLKLYGFNNLTKNLSFSFYKLHYLVNSDLTSEYNQYINQRYSAKKLTSLLSDICHAIGGNILNIAQQDYQPQGASVTLMISEEAEPLSYPESLVAHLDKSHICVHTYPDDNIHNNIAIFRADIELSTCGVISPLKVLNYLLEEFDADVIDIDYRVRGMTRDLQGRKKFKDQMINNVSDHISAELKTEYQYQDCNLLQNNLFHSKLSRKNVSLNKSLFPKAPIDLATTQRNKIVQSIKDEQEHIYTN